MIRVADDGETDVARVILAVQKRQPVTATPEAARTAMKEFGMDEEAIERRFRFAKTGSFNPS